MATASSPSPIASARTSSPKCFLPCPCTPTRPGPRLLLRLRAGSVKQWREFEDEAGAVKEWREFENAVRSKDLSRALRFLQSVEPQAGPAAMQVAVPVPPGRDWEVLDACIDADDMRLVGRAYQFLSDRGFLANFGKCKNIVLEGPREVTPTVLKEMTGLEAAKLAPKKWGLSGGSSYVLIGFIGGVSYLLTQGIDIRPNLGAILALATADALFLGGTCLAQISCFWPPYKRRILVHEAGHLLTAYLMGCPIRGVILDPFVALRMGIQGQAGTQFWDEKMEKELAEDHLSSTAFDRYCMILFAGIAAEALVYGEAEGGENDENLFRSLCILLNPPLSVAQMANRARWSVMQSYNLLKWHKKAHRAAVKALEDGHSLSTVIRRIEEAIASDR
uniref:Peptidase M41 domain-containing protein n=1 Tax=Arundo donax TaxID=35708 RepID=A0A0A9BCB9_ARUDO